MAQELRSGLYRHHSGLMVLVLGVARHSETEEELVCYIPLGAKAGPRITVRPYDMFFETIEINRQTRSRFEYIGETMPAELAENYKEITNWGQPKSGH